MWRILIGLSICTEVHGYAAGNVEQSCQTMSPLHNNRAGVPFAPQGTTPPYSVHYEHGRKGEPLTVILSSNTNTEFVGFMLEARLKGMVDEGPPVGKFIPLDDGTRLLKCSNVEGTAVSQRYNSGKTKVRVNWTAQGEDLDITFRATFVQEYKTFWERVDVNVTSPTPPPPPPPITTTPTQASTTSTAKPSTTASTAKISTTASTAKISTTASAAKPSTTASTAKTSTTASAAKPSTTASAAKPSTTASTAKISTTASTAKPSTTASTAKISTTASTAKTSTTASTAKPSTITTVPKASRVEEAGTALMTFNTVFIGVKMELVNIFTTTLTNSPFSRGLIKASQILGGLLCAAAEISTLVLFYMDNSFKATLISLVCVAIVMRVIELVIISLPIGPSHELKEICDTVVKVCSVISTIFTTAVVFLGVLEAEACLKNKEESWLLKVMIAYTVWIFLSVIWTFVFSIHKYTTLRRSKIGSSKYSHGWTETRKKKKLGAAEVIVTAVSVILIIGTMSFTAALIVGIFSAKQACA